MSLQDKLRGMLYSADTVGHQNAAIYLTKKKKTPLKEEEQPNPDVSTVTPYSADTFMDMWKAEKQNIIEKLEEKFPVKFDYILKDNGIIHIYLRPNANKIRKIKPDAILGYEPEGQIKITPDISEEKEKITRVIVQVKYNMYGDNFNKRTINVTAPNAKMVDVTKEVVDVAYTLAKNLSLI